MATKKKNEEVVTDATEAVATETAKEPMVFSTPPVVLALDPATVHINPAYLARKGDPKKADIEDMASNMMELRDMGQPHQIQNGRVTVVDGITYLVDGRHRLEACKRLTASSPDEPFLFFAEVVPSTDEQALFTASSANEFRIPPNVFDQADVAKRMHEQGKTYDEIAKLFRTKSKNYIGDLIGVSKLPKKAQAMYPDKITLEGLIALARYNNDPTLQEELRAAEDAAYEARTAAIAGAEERSHEGEADGEEEGKAKKKSKGSAPVSEAVKTKKKRGPRVAAKVTGKSVKKRAEAMGLKKKAAGRSFQDLIDFLTGNFGEENKEVAPEPIRELAEGLEAYRDNALSDLQLRNRFKKCCKDEF